VGKKRTVKTKAWLVTWEWCGDHAKREDIFAAVLNPRFSTQKICEIVELMYRLAEYSLSDQAGYARNKSPNHPATIDRTTDGRVHIHCGHNPFLRAGLVDDLIVEKNAKGKEIVSCKECPQRVRLVGNLAETSNFVTTSDSVTDASIEPSIQREHK
jgi:hypothetical protein